MITAMERRIQNCIDAESLLIKLTEQTVRTLSLVVVEQGFGAGERVGGQHLRGADTGGAVSGGGQVQGGPHSCAGLHRPSRARHRLSQCADRHQL